jgi:demethylmenaquinone methyltransferase / 2-methoxy-6-polyprenyl-1,4-benzoquinol methylase
MTGTPRVATRSEHAERLFAGIAAQYERVGAVWSFGQDARWRRFLVSRVNAVPGSWVLDVATGTGLVARELAGRRRVRVAAVDRSDRMLRAGREPTRRAGLQERLRPILGRAERLPFGDATFDSVTFTYLLRYVDDPAGTLAELARVLRPGGVLAGLEFFVPQEPVFRAAWRAYTRGVMPATGRLVSPAWGHTGRFLGRSVEEFYARGPLPKQIEWWQRAGMHRVRSRVMSLGAGVVIWGCRQGT